jgi:hypothetical protein
MRRPAILLGVLMFFVVVLAFHIYWRSRDLEERTRAWMVAELSQRFESTIELGSLRVRLVPTVRVAGTGLVVHYHNRLDVPPLIRVSSFSFSLGLLGVFRAPRHISSVTMRDMTLIIPPRENGPVSAENRALPTLPSSGVVIDRVLCDRAVLLVLSGKAGKEPLDFRIHDLVLTGVGAGQPFVFRGSLTNAKPTGEITTNGTFGPWDADEPGDSPVSGRYQFTKADLGPFPGIGGILSSTGSYDGRLNRIHVAGVTDTPDFSLDPVGRKMALHTDFDATVDGTDGDTYLHPVTATLGRSVIVSAGSVVRTSAQGHLITLDVNATKARFEDVLSLAVKSAKVPMNGPLHLRTKLVLPPGNEAALDKLVLEGDFDAEDARFASSEIRQKLESLSRHALGKPDDQQGGSALSGLKGHFRLENGVVTFRKLRFSVEGALILLDGDYQVRSGNLDFRGELRLEATLSRTMTGLKSVLAKPFDPLFKKEGAGTVLPIRISGNREDPVFEAKVLGKTLKKQVSSVAEENLTHK